MPPTKLDNLLKTGGPAGLEKIIRRAKNLDALTTALRDCLEPELADQLLAANVRDDDELVAVCSSSAWASRIRFHSDALLDAAGKAGFKASSMRVTVSQPR